MRLLSAIVLGLALAGCTTAGPFVTNISSAGNGQVSVEKCKAEYNGFLGSISTGDCMTQTVHLGDLSANPR